MAHQLYVLQVLTLNLREERMMTKMDPSDQVGAPVAPYGLWGRGPAAAAGQAHCPPCPKQAQRDILFELRRIAFEAEAESGGGPGGGAEKRKAIYTRDYKTLGFTVGWRCAEREGRLGRQARGQERPVYFHRTLSILPWTSFRPPQACWPWTTCSTWPNIIRTPTSE